MIRTSLIVGALVAAAVLSQTRVPVTQIRDPQNIVTPTSGTMIGCDSAGCRTYIDGANVMTRIAPPTRPGPCQYRGVAVDAAGYLYLCETGRWLRSPQPMLTVW